MGVQKVLVTDDDEALRKLISFSLKREGYTVETAENGRESLDKIYADGFDALLLDLMMPVMSGFEVLDELRRSDKRLCVIVISAVPELYLERVREQVEYVLPKPFELSELAKTLRACVEAEGGNDAVGR